jgi:c-di-GMP-binding flagellar brake protein YcgR
MKHATESQDPVLRIANIRDVSRGGFAFFSEEKIKEGSVLQLRFLPPNRRKPVTARAKVVRCLRDKKKLFKIGVQFMDVSEEGRRAIQELEAHYLAAQKKAQP